MTTSPTPFLSDVADLSIRIPEDKLVYFRARLKQRLHAFILEEFLKLVKARNFTKADLARRLGKKPEQITRWLGAPGNMELETISDLLLGMATEPGMYPQYLAFGAIRASDEGWKHSPEEAPAAPNSPPSTP